jgi:para-aminobenzoate synthetase / 4-amino-4-deoxychorismate lyase
MATPPAPDRAQGLFETLLILDGEPVELEAHLDRIAASLAALFGAELPPGLAAEVRTRARGVALGRLRIDVDPAGAGAALSSEDVDLADFFPGWERAAVLGSLPCEGGLGPHKWADRRPLGRAGKGTVPLLVDADEEVLEAGRANVFLARGGALFTPAADGRILPGIARAGAVAAAREAGIEVTEGAVWKAELLSADEVFLTGSVRGVEPARSLDGASLPPPGALSRRVGEGLRRRWLGAPVAAVAPAPAAAPRPGPPAR